jgi:hypothetical protein
MVKALPTSNRAQRQKERTCSSSFKSFPRKRNSGQASSAGTTTTRQPTFEPLPRKPGVRDCNQSTGGVSVQVVPGGAVSPG